jgi:membrane fusion protein (multidrug efflux system)
MKKFGIAILATSIGLASCGGDQSVEELNTERKDMVAAQKEAVREYQKALHVLDSTIIAHPDSADLRIQVKTVAVTTGTVDVKTFEHFFEVHGNVEVEENAALFAEAPGTIKKIAVKEGQQVKKGQLIIALDASAAESGLKELQKGYELANKVFEKQSALWDQKIGSEIQFLEAKNRKESLEQKLTTMKEQLDMYNIRAPFAGIVDEIMPRVGEAAAPGFPVARVLNLRKIYLESDVSEKYISTLKAGSFVSVMFPSLNEEVIAKVTRVGNFINPANRTFKLRVEFPNPNGKYKPNQLAVLKIRDYMADQSIVIPSKIIQQDRDGNDYVYTFTNDGKNDRVKKLIIKVGQEYKGAAEILKGLDSNTVFIYKGAKNVQSGDAIEIK